MRTELLLKHLLLVVTVLVAAFAFAPAKAQAHAGYNHNTRPAVAGARFVVPSAATIESRTVQVASAAKIREKAATSRKSESISPLRVHGANSSQTGAGGCCSSAIAASLPMSFAFFIPAPDRASLIVAVIGRTGITPGALPEPPKSLV